MFLLSPLGRGLCRQARAPPIFAAQARSFSTRRTIAQALVLQARHPILRPQISSSKRDSRMRPSANRRASNRAAQWSMGEVEEAPREGFTATSKFDLQIFPRSKSRPLSPKLPLKRLRTHLAAAQALTRT